MRPWLHFEPTAKELLKETVRRIVAGQVATVRAGVHITKRILSPVTGCFLIWKSLHLNRRERNQVRFLFPPLERGKSNLDL